MQRYGYVPAVVNVNRKLPPGVPSQGGYGHVGGGGPGGAIALLFHIPAVSLVDVWLVVPLLLQATALPTATRTVSGENLYSDIVTEAAGGGFPLPPPLELVGLDPPHAVASTVTSTSTRILMASPFVAPRYCVGDVPAPRFGSCPARVNMRFTPRAGRPCAGAGTRV